MNKVKTTSLIERSVNSLQWFYTMVLSLAVVRAVQQIVEFNSITKEVEINFNNL